MDRMTVENMGINDDVTRKVQRVRQMLHVLFASCNICSHILFKSDDCMTCLLCITIAINVYNFRNNVYNSCKAVEKPVVPVNNLCTTCE